MNAEILPGTVESPSTNVDIQLAGAAIQAAWNVLAEAAESVRTSEAAPGAIGVNRASEDPYLILRFGQFLSRLHAAEGLLARAAQRTDSGEAYAAAETAAAEASVFAREVALEIVAQLHTWDGRSDHDRHWRDVSVHSRQGANHWNYFHAGRAHLGSGVASNSTSEAARGVHPGSDYTSLPVVSRAHARVIASNAEAIQVARDVARTLAPGASTRDRERRVPIEELDRLSRSGLLGISVPRAFGGADVSTETLVRVFQILSAADPAIGQLPQNHFVFVDAIRQDGSPEQQKLFFSELLTGARFGNAQAERGGTSALNLSTRLTRAPGGRGYRLNGTKYYCTGAIAAQRIPVAAIDEDSRLVLAYVRGDSAGVQVSADWNAMGQRVTFSGTTVFNEVAVPEDQVIEHWRLFERPNLFHPFGQLLHAAIDIGIAQNALDDTAAQLRKRKRPRLGAPVERALDDPHVILRFGQLTTRFHAAEQLLLRAARLFDGSAGALTETTAAEVAVAVSEAKAFAEDVVMEIASDLFALLGSSSTDEDLNLHRHWRNARTHTVHDANQWRYYSAGDYFLNGVKPGKPVRKRAAESAAPTEASQRIASSALTL